MTTSRKTRPSARAAAVKDPISAYSRSQPPASRAICDRLRTLIDAALPKAAAKVWHGSPVWFIGENPVVGYDVGADRVNLLFWNGTAFDEPGLERVGQHRAARATFEAGSGIDAALVRRCLKKARADVFDSKAYFARLRAKRSGGTSGRRGDR
jgi:hypothetical protein